MCVSFPLSRRCLMKKTARQTQNVCNWQEYASGFLWLVITTWRQPVSPWLPCAVPKPITGQRPVFASTSSHIIPTKPHSSGKKTWLAARTKLGLRIRMLDYCLVNGFAMLNSNQDFIILGSTPLPFSGISILTMEGTQFQECLSQSSSWHFLSQYKRGK